MIGRLRNSRDKMKNRVVRWESEKMKLKQLIQAVRSNKEVSSYLTISFLTVILPRQFLCSFVSR